MSHSKELVKATSLLHIYPEPPIVQVEAGTVLETLEPEADVREKVGQKNQWLHIRTPDGVQGYVSAASVSLSVPADELAKEETVDVSFSFGVSSVKVGVKVKVVSPEVGYLNVRAAPSTGKSLVTKVDDGAILQALEPRADVLTKVGQQDQWLHIRTPDGTEGYVAAWYLVKASLDVKVESPEIGYLRIRSTPSTDQPPIAQVDHGAILEALEPEADVRAKIGQQGQWLQVRTPDGVEGYTAAWYLSLPGKAAGDETVASKPVAPGTPTPRIVVNSGTGLNIRQGAGTNNPVTWHVGNKTVLDVLEDPAQAGGKVGKDHWIKIRTPSLHEGYVNGAYVQAEQLADKRKPVDPASVPQGESAWIFGIHGAGATTPVNFRFLFEGKNKTGWVLFTEAIGDNPNHGGGHDYTPWSGVGYGVIVRLNNGYEPSGTLPVSAKYPGFAQACARYVQNSKGCRVWIIGNEQNNVREHPGGAEHPTEHITPKLFAKAFNLARQRIKEVDPNAQVVLGAVDPYNTYPWAKMGNKRNRPLEYHKEMLSHVDDLDGIALHTYTHWMEVNLITSKAPFGDEFLKPGTVHEHYYDFYAYRPFAEAIPAKWHDRPIYITESNHWLALDHRPNNPQEETRTGWVNKDSGWIQAAYAEINRWNNIPHVPQIHCLLLYRWTGDAWAMEKHGELHKDFKKALDHDYRWRQ
ncbi:MAG: SH3 domain-containing protein [Anaerolineae bacterium]